MRNPKILVIDSGIGGLSVTQHIRNLCPGIAVTYIADLAYFPYGQKAETLVTQRITRLVEHGIATMQPDLVVIACNTASTIALDALRRKFSIPFVGVVPAIKPAAASSISGMIGVLATRGTVNRAYTKNLIQEFAQHTQVHLHGSSMLVEMAERKLRGDECSKERIAEDLQPLLIHRRIDAIVLACTHFPLLKQELAPLFPQVQFWVDSGEAIARRTAHLLEKMNLSVTGSPPLNHLIVTGGVSPAYQQELLTPLLGDHAVVIEDL